MAQKSIIITGGASGIGLAMTRHLASQGHQIAVLDINASSGSSTVASIAADYPNAKLSFKQCDVSSWESQAAVFKEVVAEHGKIDVVLANAGISEQGSSSMSAISQGEPTKPNLKVLDVNLFGAIYSVKLAIHYFQNNPEVNGSRGSIICTASNAGLYQFPVAPLYATSKFGVIGLVRALGVALMKEKIQVNAFAPAVLETNIAPSKDLFKNMIVTPFSTLTRGLDQFLNDTKLTGEIAEIHGDNVTLRPPHEYVDEDSKTNLQNFWGLGYA